MCWRIYFASIIDFFRRFSEHPEDSLREVRLNEGMVFLDVGCTLGFYSFPASRIVGSDGTVIALDINPDCIDWVSSKIEKEGLDNIKTFVGDACDTDLEPSSVDMVFLHLVFHEIEQKELGIREFFRVLKDKGILVIDEENVMPTEEVKRFVTKENFRFKMRMRGITQVFTKNTESIG